MSNQPSEAAVPSSPAAPVERSASSARHLKLDDARLDYTVTASTIVLRDDKDQPRATLFSVAYVLDGVEDGASRPVTFCFNGGPGSSAVWLQFGGLGPKRVDLPDTLAPVAPPHRLVDNPAGLLDLTDLVFVDPIGTGFSQAAGEAKAQDFYEVDADAAVMGEFIRAWLSRHNRWSSPRYVAGESYGTTRAAGLAAWLSDRGVALNGLVLVSLATDFQQLMFEPGNVLPHVLFLPAYAAVAWYHERLTDRPDSFEGFLKEVRAFAYDVYAPALLKGFALPEQERVAIAQKLGQYTGLSAAAIHRRGLLIEDAWFARALLGDGGDTVGRLDARYVGSDDDPNGLRQTRDPSYDAAIGVFTSVANDFVRREVGWPGEAVYEVFSNAVNEAWSRKQAKRYGYLNTTPDLQRALTANPSLKVIVLAGLFDLATPFAVADHTVAQLRLATPEQVSVCYYQAGHMMYLHPPSLKKMRWDLTAFYGGISVEGTGGRRLR